MAILIDDGTMDTVIRCDRCGCETRFSFDATTHASDDDPDGRDVPLSAYDAFVEECKADVDDNCFNCDLCECGEPVALNHTVCRDCWIATQTPNNDDMHMSVSDEINMYKKFYEQAEERCHFLSVQLQDTKRQLFLIHQDLQTLRDKITADCL